MDPLDPFPALAAFLIALLSAWLLGRIWGVPPAAGRYASIDGLRGFLAFSVFLHHSAYWYFYVRTGQWGGIQSHLYIHFGESAVAMFFMITGFLFFSKLLDSRARPIDWRRLYVSRIARLVPLYLFAMLALFTVVAIESGLHRRVPLPLLLTDAARWLGFSTYGQPDLNGVTDTRWIIAGVTWSLPYEWAYYLALPIGGLLVGGKPPLRWLGISLIGTLLLISPLDNQMAYLSFLGGIAAAFVVRSPRACARLSGAAGAIVAIACVVSAVVFFPSAYSRGTPVLLSIAFIIIACGNTLFGALVSGPARKLGEMGYSLYMLHGILLYTTFRYLIGFDTARTFTPEQHWLTILLCVPMLVVLCAATYRLIEAPGMNAAPRIDAWLKRRLGRSVVQVPLP